jgi:hypothetical protein
MLDREARLAHTGRRETLPHRRAPIWKDGYSMSTKPAARPRAPFFSSGPCAKRPGWSLDQLKTDVLGRSHRAKLGKDRLKLAIDLTREVLQVPADYRIGIVPASDTGAVEMAMWTMLGQRPVEMLAWESFGEGWVTDAVKQLKLDARVIKAPTANSPISRRSTPRLATWCSPGTAPPPACACRTPIGSRRTGKASRSATPPRRPLRSAWTSPSSMW